MGPSGSGKTALLDILSMRSVFKRECDVYLNNKSLNVADLRTLSEYVEQEDRLIGMFVPLFSVAVISEKICTPSV